MAWPMGQSYHKVLLTAQRQTGQFACIFSHRPAQLSWNIWKQGSSRTSSPTWNSAKQIGQEPCEEHMASSALVAIVCCKLAPNDPSSGIWQGCSALDNKN